jgi:large subunit ribosomal protein L10
MKKEDKTALISELQDKIGQYQHFYLTNIEGLDAEKTSALRRACFKQDIKLVMAKNTLLKKALEAKGIDASLFAALKGNTALMLSNTGNAPAKLIKEFTKQEKDKEAARPQLKAAYVEETIYLGAQNLEFLSAIKSKNELIGELVALLQSPAKNVISALQSGGTTIHGVLKTLGERAE